MDTNKMDQKNSSAIQEEDTLSTSDRDVDQELMYQMQRAYGKISEGTPLSGIAAKVLVDDFWSLAET